MNSFFLSRVYVLNITFLLGCSFLWACRQTTPKDKSQQQVDEHGINANNEQNEIIEKTPNNQPIETPTIEEPNVCGNGKLALMQEQCDDGNLNNDDGCDQYCRREVQTVFVTTNDKNFQTGSLWAISQNDLGTPQMLLNAQSVNAFAFVRVFQNNLYVVNVDFAGNKNNIVTFDIKNNYQPKCSDLSTNCQLGLGDRINPHDLWALNDEKIYITSYDKNTVMVVNPMSLQIVKEINIGESQPALFENLSQYDSGKSFEPDQMILVGKYLFVSLQMLVNFSPVRAPDGSQCPYLPGRIAVIDTNTDEVVKIIPLRGSNPASAFVYNAKTQEILIATLGSQATFDNEKCHGIEKIDTNNLTYSGLFASEEQMSGTIMNFTLGLNNALFGFVTSAQKFWEYSLSYFNPLLFSSTQNLFKGSAPDLLQFSGLTHSPNGQKVYTSIPYSVTSGHKSQIRTYSLNDGTDLNQTITLDQTPFSIATYPGPQFSQPF